MGVCRFIFDYMLNSHAFLYISFWECFKLHVYMDGVNCSLFLNIYIYILFFVFYMFEKYSGDLQLFFSFLTSDVCCLNIPLLLGEKDMLYLCNKVSVYTYFIFYLFIFFFGGGGGS